MRFGERRGFRISPCRLPSCPTVPKPRASQLGGKPEEGRDAPGGWAVK